LQRFVGIEILAGELVNGKSIFGFLDVILSVTTKVIEVPYILAAPVKRCGNRLVFPEPIRTQALLGVNV
jgi:hypothetical protein